MNYRKISLFVLILLFATVPYMQAQTCSPAPVGLVSWWSADGNTLDSRSRNNGMLQNATFTAGNVGQAFNFSGSNQAVVNTVNGNILNFGTSNVSVEAWVRATGGSGTRIIYDNGFANNNSVRLFINAANQGSFFVRDDNGNLAQSVSTAALNDSNWHHLVGVRQGTTATLFVDGVAQIASSNPLLGVINSNCGNTFIGGTATSSFCPATAIESFFTGQIDEVSLYNRALSASEIQAIFNAGTAGKCKPTATVAPSNLVGWWSGDGSANDISGSGNNGTLQNGTAFAIGRVGQAFSFNSANNTGLIVPGNSPSLNPTEAITFEAWIKPSGFPNAAPTVFRKDAGNLGTTQYSLVLNISGQPACNIGPVAQAAGGSVALNQWSHLACTYDRQNVRLYINGVQIAASAATTAIPNSSPFSLGIGTEFGFNDRDFDGLIDEPSIYNRALTSAEVTSIFNAGIAGKFKDNATATGSNVAVSTKSDGMVTFPTVTNAGTTQQIPLDLSLLPALPMGMAIGLNYDVATSAVFTGSPSVCFNIPASTPAQFPNLRIFHLESGAWINRTAAGNTFPNLCSISLTSFSPFAVAQVAPSAATASISGRVSTSNGSGIRGASVSLTNSNGEVFRTVTGSFGYYRFENLPVGETYILSISAKRYSFANPTRVINLNDELANADFIVEGK